MYASMPISNALSSLLFHMQRPTFLTSRIIVAAFFCVLIVYHLASLSRFPDLSFPFRYNRNVHVIEQLHKQALARHHARISRQSPDLATAIANYRKRYSTDPPRGFTKWFEAAQAANSTIIDDFDLIREQLASFRHYLDNKFDLTVTADDRAVFASSRLLHVCFGSDELEINGFQEEWFVSALREMMQSFDHEIPELCILMNTLDEPREILPAGVLPEALQPDEHSLSFRHVNGHQNLCKPPQTHEFTNANRKIRVRDLPSVLATQPRCSTINRKAHNRTKSRPPNSAPYHKLHDRNRHLRPSQSPQRLPAIA